MRRLLLLFTLCLLLANTELRAQENDTQQLLRLLKSLCVQGCYSKYLDAIGPKGIYDCFNSYSYLPWPKVREYCDEGRIRARAREEYEMCLLSCQHLP